METRDNSQPSPNFEQAAEILKKYKHDNRERFEGKRCFVVGNGPSLRPEDLDRITDEFSIASNRIYLIFDRTEWRPNIYTALDTVCIRESAAEMAALKAELKLLAVPSADDMPAMGDALPLRKITNFNNWLETGEPPLFSEDITDRIYHGMTVTYLNIQIAAWLGFKEIILIGMDHQYAVHWHVSKPETGQYQCLGVPGRFAKVRGVERNHFYASSNDNINGGSTEAVLFYWIDAVNLAYASAKKYAKAHGIRIINATRGGKLEIFDRVNFDKLMSPKLEQVKPAASKYKKLKKPRSR